MAADGTALGPAILFLDGRSRAQAAAIREAVGEERFLAEACNLPVSGGSSLASILWIREHQTRDVGRHGHVRSLQHVPHQAPDGQLGHRPLDDLDHGPLRHGAARPDLECRRPRGGRPGPDRLPPLMQSYDPVGPILPAVARELGLPADVVVLCGGNDATLAAFSGRPDRSGRRQHHQRHLRHRQRLHRPARLVARLQRPRPHPARPLADVLRPQHRRRGAGVVPRAASAASWTRRPSTASTCRPCCTTSSPPVTLDEREAALPSYRPLPERQPLLPRAAHRGLRRA